MEKIVIYPASDSSLFLQGLGNKLPSFQQLLAIKLQSYILDFIPAYKDLLVLYDLLSICHEELINKIEMLWESEYHNLSTSITKSNKIINIPVYYGVEVGWDLVTISKQKKISVDNIIKIHSSTTYKVLAVGFRPGFAYLGDLEKNLHLPRKQNARMNVPQGSVAIANAQSAVYPSNGAGGWNIIGKTFLPMLNWKNKHPCLLQMGDLVRFKIISKEKFLNLGGKIIKE